MNRKMQTRTIIILSVVFVLLVAAIVAVYFMTRQAAEYGEKKLSVTVVTDGHSEVFEFRTDAETLRKALDEKNLISGEDSGFSFFITTVNGVTADSSKFQWWCITKGGEEIMLGVNDIMISDGDKYELTLITDDAW